MTLSFCPLCSYLDHPDGIILRAPSTSQGRRGHLWRVIGSKCSLLPDGVSESFPSETASKLWWEAHRVYAPLNEHEDERRRFNLERLDALEEKLRQPKEKVGHGEISSQHHVNEIRVPDAYPLLL